MPIGARLHERLKPLGFIRLWLLVLLIGWSSGATAAEFNSTGMKATTTSLDPLTDYNIYEFKFCLGYGYHGADYFSHGYSKVTFYLDGQEIGSIDTDVLKKFRDLAREKSNQSAEYKSLQTIKGNIYNVTDVHIGINDILKDGSSCWYTVVRLGIERHWSYKSSYTFEARCTAGGYYASEEISHIDTLLSGKRLYCSKYRIISKSDSLSESFFMSAAFFDNKSKKVAILSVIGDTATLISRDELIQYMNSVDFNLK